MSSFGWNTSLVENDDYYFDEIITDFYDLSNNQKVEIAYFDSNNDGIKEMVVKLISKIENDYLLLFSYHQEGLSLDYIIENSSNCSFQIDQFGIIYGGQASAGAACAYSEELYDSQKIHLLFTKESYFWDSVYEFDEELFAKYYDRYECPDDIKYINVSLQNGNSKELFFTYKKMQDENVNMKTEDEILQSIISELESKGRKYISYDEYLKKIQDEYNRYNIVADPDNHVEVIYQEILNL